MYFIWKWLYLESIFNESLSKGPFNNKPTLMDIIYWYKKKVTSPWLKQWQLSLFMMMSSMETFSALLALCLGNSLVTSEFCAQRPVTQSFDVFFDLHLE